MKTSNELFNLWQEERRAFWNNLEKNLTPVQRFKARVAMEQEFLNKTETASRALKNVCAWNIMTILAGYKHFGGEVSEIPAMTKALSRPLEEIVKNTSQFLPLSDFLHIFWEVQKRLGTDPDQLAFDLGKYSTQVNSFGPIADWATYVRNPANLYASLFTQGPVSAAMQMGVRLTRYFNDTKDSVVADYGVNFCTVVYAYKPWVDSEVDAISIPFTNGHFAAIPGLFKLPCLGATNELCQWSPIKYLQLRNLEAELLDTGQVVCEGEVVAQLCQLQPALYKNGDPVLLSASRDFQAQPYLSRAVPVTGMGEGWLALQITQDYPHQNPVIRKGEIFNAPYHTSRYEYRTVPLRARIKSMREAERKVVSGKFAEEQEHFLILEDSHAAIAKLEQQERELKEQRAKVVEDLKTELRVVVHDLRNPLAGVKGWCQTLISLSKDGVLDKELLEEGLEGIEESAEFMDELIEDILNAIRIVEGQEVKLECKEISLLELMDRVKRHADKANKAGSSKAQEIDGEDLLLRVDPKKIRQVIVNFLTNAFKYSDGKPLIRWIKDKNELLLAVMDRGRKSEDVADSKGVTQQDAAQLFQLFSRLENHSGIEGNGIGLTIVLKNIAAHGGVAYIEGYENGTPDSPHFSTSSTPRPAMLRGDYRTAFVVALPLT